MKIMTPVLIALISTAAFAQTLPPLDPARQAERDARDRDTAITVVAGVVMTAEMTVVTIDVMTEMTIAVAVGDL